MRRNCYECYEQCCKCNVEKFMLDTSAYSVRGLLSCKVTAIKYLLFLKAVWITFGFSGWFLSKVSHILCFFEFCREYVQVYYLYLLIPYDCDISEKIKWESENKPLARKAVWKGATHFSHSHTFLAPLTRRRLSGADGITHLSVVCPSVN